MNGVRGGIFRILPLCLALSTASLNAQNQRPLPGPHGNPAAELMLLLDRARIFGNDGHADSALALIARIPAEHAAIAPAMLAQASGADVRRYKLVGKAAPAVEGDHWLNAPAGTRRMTPAGTVTIVEFTAHWCGPCQPTYAILDGLATRFGAQLQIIIATELYGQFEAKPLKPAAELARDSSYFAGVLQHRLPIAIADQPLAPVIPGNYGTVNTDRYGVEPLPQIVVIDRHGIVRRIMVGGDDQLAARLQRVVAELVAAR